MSNAPILFFKDGLWYRQCERCPKLMSHRYKSQLRHRFCSHSCQLKGNKLRVGKMPGNAYKQGETIAENNTNWKGDGVGYFALHDWIRRRLGTPSKCENCGTTRHTRYEWANISGEYLRDLTDWVRLCKNCHVLIDDSDRGLLFNRVS